MVSLVVASCTSTATTPTTPTEVRVDSAFALAVGQSARLHAPDATIHLVAVPEDSRCPSDPIIRCVWAGNGRVRLRVESAGRIDTVDLNTMLDPHERAAGPLSIRLVALDPQPSGTGSIPSGDYRATLLASVRRDTIY